MIFRVFLHEKGFEFKGRKFKLFTFSQLYGNYQIDKENKIIIFPESVKLTVSSVVDDFNQEFLKTCLSRKNLTLNNQLLEVQRIAVNDNNYRIKDALVKTLSPITVYSTVYLNGRKKTIYYFPEDSLFQKYIRDNLIKKAELIYGRGFDDAKFEIKAIQDKTQMNILYYKQFVIKGSSGLFEIRGDEELIHAALNCGLGSKNSQGLGCIQLIRAI